MSRPPDQPDSAPSQDEGPVEPAQVRPSARVAIVCGLLLLASAINYLDRQTLTSASVRIRDEFQLLNAEYGNIEAAFGYGFVVGSVLFGFLADIVSVRWLYPIVLLSWSAATSATALAEGYEHLLGLRFALGVFEAGHWPCGVRVVRSLTQARGRTMGNGLLQSGTSIGAILAPMIMLALLTDDPGSWRSAFVLVGAVGIAWVVAWFGIVRSSDLPVPNSAQNQPTASLSELWNRKLILVLVVVCLINTAWQLLRAWLHLFLQEGRGYTERQTLLFNSAWFIATDVGCLGVGAAVLWLCEGDDSDSKPQGDVQHLRGVVSDSGDAAAAGAWLTAAGGDAGQRCRSVGSISAVSRVYSGDLRTASGKDHRAGRSHRVVSGAVGSVLVRKSGRPQRLV
ncbi:MAG: MFS transporter [Planctomycetaceae bacterium]